MINMNMKYYYSFLAYLALLIFVYSFFL